MQDLRPLFKIQAKKIQKEKNVASAKYLQLPYEMDR